MWYTSVDRYSKGLLASTANKTCGKTRYMPLPYYIHYIQEWNLMSRKGAKAVNAPQECLRWSANEHNTPRSRHAPHVSRTHPPGFSSDDFQVSNDVRVPKATPVSFIPPPSRTPLSSLLVSRKKALRRTDTESVGANAIIKQRIQVKALDTTSICVCLCPNVAQTKSYIYDVTEAANQHSLIINTFDH